MYTFSTQVRVRYAETDRMGYVYYGNYSMYFEIARVEMLRSLGISYKEWEDKGVMLPVVNYEVNYKKPAFYDDLLTIKVKLSSLPSSKIYFEYEVINEKGDLLSTANTTLVFVNTETKRPTKPPQDFMDILAPHFN
ncbi:MAG: acyl-CoA thioester hydrolase [Sphingobacteriales bacterium]|jgi:acyl-CoA thioester hydrolase